MQGGSAEFGVVPFENSTHGVVNFTLDGLADRAQTYADLGVCGEVYLDVHHFLLGYKQKPQQQQEQHEEQQQQHLNATGGGTSTPTQTNPNPRQPRAKPLEPLGHVQRVLSHPQAFGQTNAFLSTYLRGVDCVDVSSTSKAAETASRDETGATAAIAGEIAADMFGLDVLARCIEDRDDNTTRFFVLRRRRRRQSGSGGDGEEEEQEEKEEEKEEGQRGHKSLVSFTVPHRSPGALAGVLDVFRKYGLNLTSINSLPSLIQPFQYLFFVEFEGSRHHDPEGRVKSALEEVDEVAEGWRWLGSWESAR